MNEPIDVEFRPIPNFPDYVISRTGEVRCVRDPLIPRVVVQSQNTGGKPRVQLRRPDGGKSSRDVAGLVREVWGAP